MLKTLAAVVTLLLLVSGSVWAQEDVFTDPEGRFTVPIPTNWTAEALEGYTLLQDPDQLINVYIRVEDAESAEEAIESAWQTIDPSFDLAVGDLFVPPAPPGIDELTIVNYDMGEEAEERLVQAVAQKVSDTYYVVIFDGQLNALIQRNAQAQQIFTGLQITNVEQTDLAGVEPLPAVLVIDELEAYTADLLQRLEVPGATVAIVADGEVVYSGAFGVKALGSEEPVTTNSQFMIGSTTKPMTTTMMATLVDDELIDWDTPVVDVLPEFAVADPELTEAFTLRNLVCACTGVPRRDFEFIFNAGELDANDVIASLSTFQFFTDFGEAFQYSNQLVATGGYAAAAALNGGDDLYATYLAAMQERVFDPIGMPSTTFDFDAVVERGDYAIPHGATLGGEYIEIPLSMEELLLPIAPAGMAWSTAEDMAQYVITMLNRGTAPDGTPVVSEENLEVTWEPQVAVSADTSYGLGWLVDEYKGVRVFQHGGNTLGFTSDLAFMPDAGIGIVVLSNGQGANVFNQGVRMRFLELVYEQEAENEETIQFLLDQSEAQEAQLLEMVGEAPDRESVESFLGTYTNEALGTVEVRFEDDMLIGDAGEFTVELRPNLNEDAKPDSFLAFGPPLPGIGIRFEETDTGVELILGEALTEYTFERADQG